jgi:hypothetical protein
MALGLALETVLGLGLDSELGSTSVWVWGRWARASAMAWGLVWGKAWGLEWVTGLGWELAKAWAPASGLALGLGSGLASGPWEAGSGMALVR